MKAPFLALLFFIGLKPLISIAQTTNTQAQSRSSEATSPLSAPERDLLNEINDARAHPQIYASYLEKLKRCSVERNIGPRATALVCVE